MSNYQAHDGEPNHYGYLATFDGPARAVRCARAIIDALAELGVQVRAGLHTGECELAERLASAAPE